MVFLSFWTHVIDVIVEPHQQETSVHSSNDAVIQTTVHVELTPNPAYDSAVEMKTEDTKT